MLSRGQCVSRRLLARSLHASSAHNISSTCSASSASRRTSSRLLACSRSLSSAGSPLTRQSPVPSRSLQLRSVSHVTSSCPPVPQDEYDELKSFLAEPATSGAAMERAKDIVTGWMQRHVDPAMPGQEATVMVMVADAMQSPAFVMQMYTGLRDAGVSPSPLTLELAAAACAQLGQWRTALEVIDFMHEAVEIMQPSLSIYENAIVACHADKKWMRAKHLLEEMRTHKLEASSELHVASIRLCIEHDEATATRVLLEAFLRVYDDELDEDEKRDVVTDLFHAALDAESLPQALFFRDEMLARHYPVSKELYARLIRLSAVKRRWHTARTLVQQFVDLNAPPLEAAPSDRYMDDIHRLLEDMETHSFDVSLEVCNAALRNFGQVSLFEDAMAVRKDMLKHRVQPDAVTFAALMCSCGSRVEQSDVFFRELQRAQCAPTLDVVHAYLLVPSRAEQFEEVLRRYAALHDEEPLFKDLPMEADVRVQSLLAVAYGRLHRSEEMLRVFTAMKVKGMEPNLYVYGEALFAYIRQDRWRHALMLFDHIFQQQTPEMQEQRALETFPMLWDAAIQACVQGEQTERAAVLFDAIVEQRVPVSMTTGERLAAMLTNVPPETLWQSFKPIPSLHRTKHKKNLNPRVQNAVLKRAVDENNRTVAEQIVHDALYEMDMLPNSMTYALMLRLYASREDQQNFHTWWGRMEAAQVKTTVFMFRALLHQLSNLSVDCERPEYLDVLADFLQRSLPGRSVRGADSAASTNEYAAELGRAALDAMESSGIGPDTICLQNYLLLSQDPDHVARGLAIVEEAMAATSADEEPVQLSPRLLHTLFSALDNFPDGQRVRNLLVEIVRDLPSDLSEDALAAYCAANDGHHALQLLRELLAAGCALKDEHILFFLTNSYTCESSSRATQNSRPRSGDGVVVEMASLLCESETVAMEASCLAFLIQHVVELSKWQQREYEVATQEEIDAMKKLLVRAFSHYSITQVTEFLSKVVDRDDFEHVRGVLEELQ
jgi:pentatricopeptide repeat protein